MNPGGAKRAGAVVSGVISPLTSAAMARRLVLPVTCGFADDIRTTTRHQASFGSHLADNAGDSSEGC
jgi:hypothetical protein